MSSSINTTIRHQNKRIDIFTPESLIESLSSILTHIIVSNQNYVVNLPQGHPLSMFLEPWKYEWMTVLEYLKRLRAWLFCSHECFIVAICFMRKLERLRIMPPLTQLTIHRILFTCVVLAIKFSEDAILRNADFANVGCIEIDRLNRAEVQIFVALGCTCYVSQQEFEDCVKDISRLTTAIKSDSMTSLNTDSSQYLSLNTAFSFAKKLVPLKEEEEEQLLSSSSENRRPQHQHKISQSFFNSPVTTLKRSKSLKWFRFKPKTPDLFRRSLMKFGAALSPAHPSV